MKTIKRFFKVISIDNFLHMMDNPETKIYCEEIVAVIWTVLGLAIVNFMDVLLSSGNAVVIALSLTSEKTPF